jgi:NitT/TauT family transport system permease protein
VTVNAVTGLRSVEENHLGLLRSVAASDRQVFVRLRFPYALPFIFAGLKLATTLSVLGAIVAEFMGASEGLGYLILSSTFNFEVARVFVSLTGGRLPLRSRGGDDAAARDDPAPGGDQAASPA